MERLFPWFVENAQVNPRGVYYALVAAVLNAVNLAIYVAAAILVAKAVLS